MRIEEAVDMQIRSAGSNTARNTGKANTGRDGAAKDSAVKSSEEHPNYKKSDPAYKDDVLEKIIDDLNKKLNSAGRELRCSIHKETGQVMVKVVDTDSGKTIREIPPEKSLDILAKILEQSGLLVDEKT